MSRSPFFSARREDLLNINVLLLYLRCFNDKATLTQLSYNKQSLPQALLRCN